MPMRSGRHILIVDDSDLVLELTAAALSAAGYSVRTTSQSVGASRHLAGCDLAIIDYHMPGFDGHDLVQSMRKSTSALARPPLLYLYTSDNEAAREYRRLGFDGGFGHKGDTRALLAQVDAVFRLIEMRGIANRVRKALDESE